MWARGAAAKPHWNITSASGSGLGLRLGLAPAHLSMRKALEAERRMTKSRVEISETYCVMRRRTSIIAMAKTTLETAMTFTCSYIRLDAAGTGLQPGYMGSHSLGAWGLQLGWARGDRRTDMGLQLQHVCGTCGFSAGGCAPRA